MERTFKGYANYGVLGHKGQTIYTAFNPEATADFSEEVIFTAPKNWETAENEAGELLLSPDGKTYYICPMRFSPITVTILALYGLTTSSKNIGLPSNITKPDEQ